MRAQVFITDFLIGIVVFAIIFMVGVQWWNNSWGSFQESIVTTTMEQKADSILTLLVSTPGSPYAWGPNTTINQFGFASEAYDLEGYKVENFYEYFSDNYEDGKRKLGLEEYGFNLKVTSFESEVLYDLNKYPGPISNVIKITKSAMLDNTPVRLEVLVWK